MHVLQLASNRLSYIYSWLFAFTIPAQLAEVIVQLVKSCPCVCVCLCVSPSGHSPTDIIPRDITPCTCIPNFPPRHFPQKSPPGNYPGHFSCWIFPPGQFPYAVLHLSFTAQGLLVNISSWLCALTRLLSLWDISGLRCCCCCCC